VDTPPEDEKLVVVVVVAVASNVVGFGYFAFLMNSKERLKKGGGRVDEAFHLFM